MPLVPFATVHLKLLVGVYMIFLSTMCIMVMGIYCMCLGHQRVCGKLHQVLLLIILLLWCLSAASGTFVLVSLRVFYKDARIIIVLQMLSSWL